MQPIVSAQQMIQADQHTIQSGTPGETLMEQAARACFECLNVHLSDRDEIAILCGKGNNGGDGFALARILTRAGFRTKVYCYTDPNALKGEAAHHYAKMCAADVEPQIVQAPELPIDSRTTWIVDALFGTGLKRPLKSPWDQLIQAINAFPARRLAIDLPSGLNASLGSVDGAHIKADLTVTFNALKVAHALTPACLACGEVQVRDIGIQFPDDHHSDLYFLDMQDYQREPRHLNAHKGNFGCLAILGGFRGMEGAANLAARASLRFGVGKVRILTDTPESGRFHSDSVMVGSAAKPIDPNQYQAWVIGPGLGRDRENWKPLDALALENHSVVWDADGLFYLMARQHKTIGRQWVLTPHPGEAGQLLNCSAGEIQRDRLSAIHRLGDHFPNAWILLKGYRSLIRSPQGHVLVIGTGNPALATAGSGDVLAGMIGALLAQGLAIEDSLVLATLRHGYAADRWIETHCAHGMIAEDIIDDLAWPVSHKDPLRPQP
ncbi:MAG: NAD(P)H-hydrate dehydratase [Acidobacteria bacterium]|nr:NAD(P)H-hydrate dehydratase [Acidobacteriota bacterium]MCB9396482.1 NAD(P)H-hydrate dehydratase [Acidobacteriota bacterium]